MFITLDGDSGSGKTTQMRILIERLKLEEAVIFPIFEAFYSISKFTGNSSLCAKILAHLQAVLHTPLPKHSIVEHFWLPFFNSFQIDRTPFDPDTFAKVIRFARMGMDLMEQPEPDVSIVLDVPFEVSAARRVERYTNANVKISNIEMGKLDDVNMQLYKVFEAELPYFHIVDATGSIDEITNAIIALLPKSIHDVVN